MGNLVIFILLVLSIALCIAVGIGLIFATVFVGQFVYGGIRSIFDPEYPERRLAELRKEQKTLKEKLSEFRWPRVRMPYWFAGGHGWKYYAKRNGTYPRDVD